MVFLAAAAVSFQQFQQNTTSYCDASSSLLECSNLPLMEREGDNSRCKISQSRDETGGCGGGQKCDFLLGAQQAETGAGFKWSSTMQSPSSNQSRLSGDEVCAADPSPKLSSPDAHMQAFGRKRRDYPRMISRLLRPICTPLTLTNASFHSPLSPTHPIHPNRALSHEPREAKICE